MANGQGQIWRFFEHRICQRVQGWGFRGSICIPSKISEPRYSLDVYLLQAKGQMAS
jgi:hypothetical protein